MESWLFVIHEQFAARDALEREQAPKPVLAL